MRRVRLKADGRIVEIRDGREMPLVPEPPSGETRPCPQVRALRMRSSLTQAQFAARLGLPVETIRNWEQGKRSPRGPAKALLALIAHAPDLAYAVLDDATAER
jgi:putative transcriptional regulator